MPTDLIQRARVVASSAVTWITLAVACLQYLLAQGAFSDVPEVAGWVGSGIAALTGAITILRRVSPVEASERGILPQFDAQDYHENLIGEGGE